jgi:hypothetical protein
MSAAVAPTDSGAKHVDQAALPPAGTAPQESEETKDNVRKTSFLSNATSGLTHAFKDIQHVAENAVEGVEHIGGDAVTGGLSVAKGVLPMVGVRKWRE